MKRRQEQQLRAAIGHILLHDWDPIGVREEAAAQDEYNGYISGVLRLVIGGASEGDIANHLYQNETVNIGLSPSDKARLLPIARKLRNLWKIEE